LTSQAQVARFPDLQVSWNQFVEGCLPGDFSAFVHIIVTLPENMDISSDDEDFILANLELFELQPIGASSVGEYEHVKLE
jgi:hypothetical protein